MKKFAALVLGMAMLGTSAGCYCGGGGCYTPNYLSPSYYGGGYGGGCPGGACGVGGGYSGGGYPTGVVPQGMYQGYGQVQAGYPGTVIGPAADAGAYIQPFGVPQMAVAPLEALPTY